MIALDSCATALYACLEGQTFWCATTKAPPATPLLEVVRPPCNQRLRQKSYKSCIKAQFQVNSEIKQLTQSDKKTGIEYKGKTS